MDLGGVHGYSEGTLKMDADLLRWLSSPKPRLIQQPIGSELIANLRLLWTPCQQQLTKSEAK